MLFGSLGKKLEVKKHIRMFSGFTGNTKDEKLQYVLESKKRWNVGLLKEALASFGLERSGNREELVKRFIDYLNNPSIIKSNNESKSKALKSSVLGKKRKRNSEKSDKPKKKVAPSAFLLYSKNIRAAVKLENPEAGFIDIAKLIGEKWKNLGEVEKSVS